MSKNKTLKKIVITGGHLTPALAVIEQLKSKGGWKIYYFGRKYSFEGEKIISQEMKIINQIGIEFVPVVAGRLQRRLTIHTLPSLLKVPLGLFQCLYLVFKIKPDVILSFGSYVSTPAVVAGWAYGIPVVSHEQTFSSGLANKINSFFSTLVAVSFKETLNNFPANKTIITGNPLRKDIFVVKNNDFTREVGLRKRKTGFPIIYITGGNQGASIINQTVAEILPELLKKYIIIHQTGSLNYQSLLALAEGLPESLKERYFVKNFVSAEEIGWVFHNSALVISRAGANISYELGCLGKPAILIPLPFAQKDEQLKNAQRLQKLGLAEVIQQKDLDSQDLFDLIGKVIKGLNKFQKNGLNSQRIYLRTGAYNLTRKIYELLAQKKK